MFDRVIPGGGIDRFHHGSDVIGNRFGFKKLAADFLERIERIEDSGRAGMVSINNILVGVFRNRGLVGIALPRRTWERGKKARR